ncbi:TPA: GTPase RsgA [Clostridioides difficile]|nr:GTPase RsgA [Clostridioides difficile]
MNGMKQINLQDYGLNRNFITQSMEYHDLYLVRIISQEKNFYQVVCVNGVLFAEVSGKLRFEATIQSDFPTVGDFVMLDRCNNKNGNAIIHHVLHRKSLFVCKASGKVNEEQVVAANIDIVFLCMSLNKDFNIHRLERYLSLTWESGAIPVVVLTKSDLCDNVHRKLQVVNSIALGVDVVVTSSIEPDGYKQISKYIKPGCAIWEAIAHQELSPKRWESYRRLKTEAVFADNKSEYLAKKEKKFKNISKINKKIRR